MKQKDPIDRLRRHLVKQGVSDNELEAVAARVKTELDAVVDRARRAPRPDPATVLEDVYSTAFAMAQRA